MRTDAFAAVVFETLQIREKTRTNYRGAYRRYIAPAIGTRELVDVTVADIRTLLRPLPPATQQQTLMVCKTIFREAIREGLMAASPAVGLRPPRAPMAPRRFLKWEDVETASFGRYTNQIRFLALHGLRWGEAVALTEADIYDGRVHIWRSVHGATKSRAGVRNVPYMGYFEPFPADRRSLARVLEPHGVTIHSLRRTYAYLLKTSGVHITTAQRLMGHSNPHTTLAIYTSVLDDEIELAGIQMARRVSGQDPLIAA